MYIKLNSFTKDEIYHFLQLGLAYRLAEIEKAEAKIRAEFGLVEIKKAKHRISPEGIERIRQAQITRWKLRRKKST